MYARTAGVVMLIAPLGPVQGSLTVYLVVVHKIGRQFLEAHTVRVRNDGPAGRDVTFLIPEFTLGLGFLVRPG
jgi:hypothetical protein